MVAESNRSIAETATTMMALHAATMALSAALLFTIQLMVGKALLPALGGTPAVWTTCLAFFQTVLLLGYAAAHLAVTRGGLTRTAWMFPAGFLAACLLSVSLDVDRSPDTAQPALWLLGFLGQRLFVPTLLLAMVAPLLQTWYAQKGQDPYPLYAASNTGSLAGLLGYPLLIEPRWGLQTQLDGWRMGLTALTVLISLCAGRVLASGSVPAAPLPRPSRFEAIPGRLRGRWLALSAVPSLLLVGASQYITTDLAAVPLLWALPLALYLLTFILAFSTWSPRVTAIATRAFPLVLMLLSPALAAGLVQPWWIPIHLLALFLGAMSCHGALAAARPAPAQLTTFYLAIATGGALGGLFASLVAPLVFDRIAEYPIALFAAAAVPVFHRETWSWRRLAMPLLVFVLTALLARDVGGLSSSLVGPFLIMIICGVVSLACWRSRARPVTFVLTLGAAVSASGLADARDGGLLWRDRDFFGVLRVTRDDNAGCMRLFHGSTLHGEQALDPRRRNEPRSYFARSSPIGDVFEAMATRPEPFRRVTIVGLGAGSLAAYARPGEAWTFLELDPAVVRVAQDRRFFSYLADCRADRMEVLTGDARLLLADNNNASAPSADLIVLDAFGSDAVPVHLLTREAVRLYLDRLAPGGLLAFNITNRYLDLEPVLGALARSEGLVSRVRYDLIVSPDEKAEGKQPTIWAVLSRREADLGPLASDSRWQPARDPGEPAWTDDHANPLGRLTFRSRRPRGLAASSANVSPSARPPERTPAASPSP